jgi:hypothetical protein
MIDMTEQESDYSSHVKLSLIPAEQKAANTTAPLQFCLQTAYRC